MAWLAFLSLLMWLPVVFYVFERYPLQKAITFSYVAAWLFLPPTQIPIPAFPDWSKTTATSISVLLCCYLKSSSRLLNFRPKWYDLPACVFCCCPMISSVTNGLGAYDGLSAVLEELVRWGIPYLIGRVYLTDLAGNRQLSLGLAVGGMIYMPLCLYEMRMSPVLKLQIYGFGGRDVDFGYRYGGYRPMVFLATGLELGWWMCCASLAAYMLWKSGSVRRLWGYPMAALTAGLATIAVLCRSTGAILQIVVGVLLIHLTRWTKQTLLVWALLLVAPLYCVVRPGGYWSGLQVVDWTAAYFGAERAQSVGYRFEQEEILMRSANQRPLFGYGRFGGFPPVDSSGKMAVTDGFWILVYGWSGATGLASLNLMLLLPAALFITRCKPKTWFDPEVAPVTPLAMILPLFMIDNLSNAMPNPIYALAMGSVSGFFPRRSGAATAAGRRDPNRVALATSLDALPGAGRQGLRRDLALDAAADEAEARAVEADQADRVEEAYEAFRESVQARRAAIGIRPTPARFDRLARCHVLNARFLTRVDQRAEARDERDRALALWREVQAAGPTHDDTRALHAANLNDLAWLLVADENSPVADLERGIAMSEEAVGIDPTQASFWNTLGIARYRHRDYYKSIHALSRAVSLGDGGGNAFDYYYLALANHALGYPKPTSEWFDRAEGWALRHPDLGPALDRARAEAFGVLAAEGNV